MKKLLLLISTITSSLAFSQVGINTQIPQGVFNIDGKSTTETTNPSSGVPTSAQLADDFIVMKTGATGIGGIPDKSAILDLQTENKGFVAPRVVLSSVTDVTTIENPIKGLLVFNLGTNSGFNYVGYVFWNGQEWRSLVDSTVVSPEIESLVCSSATLSPSSWSSGSNFRGNLKVSYTGGNGGSFQPGTSIVVNGLTFTLRAGKLEYGDGELTFSVSGIPTNSSDMSIPLNGSGGGQSIIPFLTASQGCTVTVSNQTTADINTVAAMGYPVNSGDGYSFTLQTPDGKYRIRVWWNVNTGTTRGRPNVQIYNNTGLEKTLFWNYDTRFGGGLVGSSGNSKIPVSVWGGFRESNTWYPMSYWGNEGIMDGVNNGPEYRRYSWIDNSSDSKVEYSAYIMAGSVNHGNPTPDETKVFIKIEQVMAL
ncbi:hypothetical protein ACYSNM_12900 [Myroides sp. LJL116]